MSSRKHALSAWLCAVATLAISCASSTGLRANDDQDEILRTNTRSDGSTQALIARADGDAIQIGFGTPNVALDCAAQSCLRLRVAPGAELAAVDFAYGGETFRMSMNTAGAMLTEAPREVAGDEAAAHALDDLASTLANAAAELDTEGELASRGDVAFGPYLCRPAAAEAKARKQRAAVACAFIVTSGTAAYFAVKKRKATIIPALEGAGASLLACVYALAKLNGDIPYEDYCSTPAVLQAPAPTASNGIVRWAVTLRTRIEIPGTATSPTTPILIELLENGRVIDRQYAPFSTIGETRSIVFAKTPGTRGTYALRASSEWVASPLNAQLTQ